MSASDIPRLHLGQRHFDEALLDGLRTRGFLIVNGHGITPGLLARVREEADWLFSQPEEDLRALSREDLKGKRGYTGYGAETAVGAKASDLKQFFHIGQEEAPPECPAHPAYAPNLWPDRARFGVVMRDFYRAKDELAARLLGSLDRALGEDGTLQEMSRGGNSVLRLVHYPPFDPERVDPAAERAAAHEDVNLLTLLFGGFVPGDPKDRSLEIQTPAGLWVPVPFGAGDCVVDGGLMLERLTAKFLRATRHRVVRPADARKPRYSYPYFVHPRPNVMLETLARFRGSQDALPPIPTDDFLEAQLRRNFAGKA